MTDKKKMVNNLFEERIKAHSTNATIFEKQTDDFIQDDSLEDKKSSNNNEQMRVIQSVLGDGAPLALSGAEIDHEDDRAFKQVMTNNLDCVEVARLKFLSEHDELTGQKNRIKLHQALEDHIIEARKQNFFCSFVIAAIDNLSVINDTFGYQLGDEVIAAVAYELAKVLRKHDVIGRYSANKFGLILPRCGPDALQTTSARLLSSISDHPIQTSQGSVPVTMSMGGVVMPQFASNAQEAVSRSLESLDNAKRNSTNGYVVYEYSSDRECSRKRNLQISEEIISALNEGRMHLSLQSIVSSTTREVEYYECLLVMETEDGQMISAGEFLPIAEKLGLCRLIDYRTLELSIDLLKQDPNLKLALNVSSPTTSDPNWLIVMRARAGRDRTVMERLTVEITETIAIQVIEETASFVSSLRDLGCSVAIDDFGAGYSSYKNLRRLDVDVVKIDGEFVREIITSKADQIFVRSLVDLAKSFNLKTVAEWVNDEETATLLKEAGVDYLQGFLFGRPAIQKDSNEPDHEIPKTAQIK